jgi:arylsulfatase A-like enzyme
MKELQRPNVLVLFSDQHKANVLSCESHPDVATPNLDRLAAEGARFARAYCQDAICVPSRCSIFTGLYPRTLGVLDNSGGSEVIQQVVSMQSAFQQAGYRTGAFGKRHLRGACDGGWALAASHMYGESPDSNYVTWIQEQGFGQEFAHDWAAEFGRGPKGSPQEDIEIPFAILGTRASRLPDGKTMEAYTAQKTRAFLAQCAQENVPFFCFSSYYRPHQPYTPLPKYWERHDRSRWGEGTNRGDALSKPPTLHERPENLPPMLEGQFHGKNRVWRLDLARADEQYYRDYVSAYYALVQEIDDHIGDVLASLEEWGLAENTIVVYTSDHGDFCGAHGMIEKCAAGHNVYEDTLRVPLIVHWPGRIAPQLCEDLVELVDLYPTLLDLCGLPEPASAWPVQGRSLAAALYDSSAAIERPYIVTENWTQATVVTPRYKLGVWIDPGPGYARDFRGQFPDLLFDRINDPLETRNLIGQPQVAEIERTLRGYLRDWFEATPDDGRRQAIQNR